MAAKTTSGSGFHFRFAFYALDFVENEYNIAGVRRTLFEIFGAKVRKFKKIFKRVTRISHSRIFDILWPLGPPTTVPKTSHFGLTFNFLWSFKFFGLSFFRPHFSTKFSETNFDGQYLRKGKT